MHQDKAKKERYLKKQSNWRFLSLKNQEFQSFHMDQKKALMKLSHSTFSFLFLIGNEKLFEIDLQKKILFVDSYKKYLQHEDS